MSTSSRGEDVVAAHHSALHEADAAQLQLQSQSQQDEGDEPARDCDDDDDDDDDGMGDTPTFHYLPEGGACRPMNAPVAEQGKRSIALLAESQPPPMYVCASCGIQLALQDEIVSKAFSGRAGKAYLFHTCMNASIGASEERQLLTGMHTVADVRCGCCDALIGWTYLRAFEASQKYKEGRFILEEGAVHKVNHWE